MNQSNVYLSGFMGSGKSAIYKKIYPLLNIKHFDLDEEIIKEHGKIETIFEEGEVHFRILEREVFSTIPNENCLVALGGGSLEVGEIYLKVKESPNTFYLDDSFENLWERIKDSDSPLVKRGKDFVLDKYQLRKILSKKLPNVIDMSKTTISEAVEIIIESTWLKNERI